MNEEIKPLKIFIGWDSREEIAYQVARQSILDTTSVPVEIIPLKQKTLRKKDMYWRDEDKLASTEFTFTRFLLPELTEFDGWALFIDCDFVALEDVANLFAQANDKYAVMCAQHDYTPKEGTKMDGQVQTVYPRKNWSSMMLVNCGHPSNKKLTKELVNTETISGAYLHRFSWLLDKEVGKLSHEWNWLVGWYKEPKDGKPKFLHYTEGGPWFEKYENCEYNYEYYKAKEKFLEFKINRLETHLSKPVEIKDLSLTPQKKLLVELFLKNLIDHNETVYKTKDKLKELTEIEMGIKVVAIAEGREDYNPKKGVYDPYLEDFILGSGGSIGVWDYKNKDDTTLVIRGLGGKSQKALKICAEQNREFYAIDTGYIQPSIRKEYHRITKNGLQNTSPLIERPGDRLERLHLNIGKHKTGNKILVCPPSEKVMKYYNQDLETWMKNTIAEIKKYTNKEIIIRKKPSSRSDRTTADTIYNALSDNIHCLVTYNSIAATEAFLFGVPAIALAPNAATSVCNNSISQIENLNIPNRDTQIALARHLSYCQFTSAEIRNGTAWNILNESS